MRAVDQASNESIVYTTYHVRYRFADSSAGWPSRTDHSTRTRPSRWRSADRRGDCAVEGARATFLVDGVPARSWPQTDSHDGDGEVFLLDARQLSEELHTLTVLLDDGTSHRTTFRLARP